MKTLLVVIGTRPEAVKMAPVIQELNKEYVVKVCCTGQHREMLDQIFNIFNISPDRDLRIMSESQDLFDITNKVLIGIKGAIAEFLPSLTLVQGDTTSALAASIASFYMNTPVAHVEAGLRTQSITTPFPEELNRRLITRIAFHHFAPTEWAKNNLLKENIPDSSISVTGNTVVDALSQTLEFARLVDFSEDITEKLPFLHGHVKSPGKKILVTMHRRESFGKGLENVCAALRQIVKEHKGVKIIFPVHFNPNIRAPVEKTLSEIENVFLIDPVDYLQFIKLMDQSDIVLTDSGGIQEEAPTLGKPVLVMRTETERPEAVKAGTAQLVGTDAADIVKGVCALLSDETQYERMAMAYNPYGDGNAAERICRILKKIL